MDSSTAGRIRVVAEMYTKPYDDGKKHIEKGNQEIENNGKTISSKFAGAWIGAIAGVAASLTNTFAGAIKSSFGDAVKRVDTLNTFPRVLQAMGISAEEAAGSTQVLAKRLKGLPTPLDSAASGVQRFIASGLNAPKATNAFLAMNNALLAAGGNAADTTIVMDSLTRAVSGGTTAATTIQAALARMPTALKALQIETGKSADELYKLYAANPQRLIDDLIRLDQQGGGGLASLSAQAMEATAGINTSIDNMRTALSRGIANIIQAVGSGGISGAFNTTSDVIDVASSKIVESIGKIKTYISNDLMPAIRGIGDDVKSGDFNSLGQKIGEGIGGFVKYVTVNTQSIIDWFAKINWGEVGMAIGKGGVAFAIGLITGLLSGEALSSALGFIKDNLGAVILAAISIIFAPSRLLSPISKILSRLPLGKLFIRIFITPIRNLFKPIREGFATAFSTVFNVITAPFRAVGGVLGKLLSNIGKTITGFIETIGIRIAYLPETIVKVFMTIVRFMSSIIGTILNVIRSGLGFIINIVSTIFNGVVNIIRIALTTGINIIRTILSTIWTVITTILRPITAFFVNLFRAAWSQIQTVFSGVGNFFRTVFTGAINIVRSIWNGITSFFSMIWNGITTVFSVVVNFFSTVFSGAVNIIRMIWSTVSGFFSSVWNGITNIFSGVASWFGNIFRSAFDAIKNIFSGLGSFFSNTWNNITKIFGDAGTKVGNAIGNSFKSVVNGVLKAAVGIINGFIKSINGAVGAINKIPGVNIGKLKELGVPQLATGGIVTAPTLAMIGEGRESEAVLPLSKLDALLENSGPPEGNNNTYATEQPTIVRFAPSPSLLRDAAIYTIDLLNQDRRAKGLPEIGVA